MTVGAARGGVGTVARFDAPVVRSVAMVRVGVAVTLAAIGSFLPGLTGRRATLFLLFALVWVPLASVVLFASDRPGSPLAAVGGPALDLLVLFAVQALVPSAKDAVFLGYVVVVAFALYTLLARSATLQARALTRYQRLRGKADTILAHVADGVVVTAGDGRIRECNPAALHIIRLPGGDVVGAACQDMLGLHVGERALDCTAGCPLVDLTMEVEDALGVEVWRHDASGRRQPLLANATAVASDDGGVEVVHSLRDLTRLKQAEEAKTLFLATASHELKTPLTVINGFAATLSAYPDLDTETREAALEAISVRAQELTRIVDRLLLSSRIEAGQIKLPAEDVDAVAVLKERVMAVGLATSRAIAIDVRARVPLVAGNREALVTVIDHLLDNALKYSPDGGLVTVTVESADGPVAIDVTDRGIGMDAEQVAHCFEKFWQAESTDVRRYGGTGIGLYIVQSLVEAMGGHVFVKSEPSRGSTFTVHLRPALVRRVDMDRRVGESTSIREFMRQIGVPERRRS